MGKNYKNPARFRLDFIKENTFNRLWSIRMTRTRVIIVTCAVVAGFAALLWCIMAYTPMRRLLPETLSGDARNRYLETALRIDSLEQQARINDAYIANLAGILHDDIPEDSALHQAARSVAYSDSILAASEAEINFVRSYEEDARFNLSVLSPLAAEGMVFTAPVTAAVEISDLPSPGIRLWASQAAAVASTYRGTVLGVYTRPDGTSAVTVQHPNDFISIYDGLGDVFVDKGSRVTAGQRIGHTSAGHATTFELWHSGNALDPRQYINF